MKHRVRIPTHTVWVERDGQLEEYSRFHSIDQAMKVCYWLKENQPELKARLA